MGRHEATLLSDGSIFAVGAGYMLVLFGVAWWGDRRAAQGRSLVANPWVYSLSLAVYCTAWTFYGSVGRAADAGIGFLTTYLGPTLAAILWWLVLRKIVRIAKRERLTSIADFVAARYGKSPAVAATVTIILLVGIVPYIALQLKAVAVTFLVLRGGRAGLEQAGSGVDPAALVQTSLGVAVVLAAFAILFGTRHLDLTEHHEGLVTAIAFESVAKLLAFVAVGAWVVFGLHDGFGDIFRAAAADPALAPLLRFEAAATDGVEWAVLTALSLSAIFLLPRQFQVSVVECTDERHLRTAAWLFPLYLLAINVFVLPIALAGARLLPAGADADTFVLTLPLAAGREMLALLVFLGGLSAATGMVIVESVALATMVSNDLVLPVLLRLESVRRTPDLSGLILGVRRLAIVFVLASGWSYVVFTGARSSLVSIGLISFAAAAQLAPAFFGGLYWTGGTRRGALAGLIAGFVVWGYTLPLPTLVGNGWLPESFLAAGPFGIGWLRPHALLGLDGLGPIVHSLFWSLVVNLGGYLSVSVLGRSIGRLDAAAARERTQARRFVDAFSRPSSGEPTQWRTDTPVQAILSLLERFLGRGRARTALTSWAAERGVRLDALAVADAELVGYAERLLAGTTGSASARVALRSVAREEVLDVEQVMRLLDETAQVLAARRALEEKSAALERASAELRAANARLQELDRQKDDFLSTVSHELRTPLTSIRALSEILHDHPDLDASRREEMLGIVLGETERLTRLIDQVLDHAKLDAEARGAQDPTVECEVFDAGALARETATGLAALARARGVELELRITDGCSVLAERDRIVQVLQNLLSNALRYAGRDAGAGSADAATARHEGWIRVAVAPRGKEVLLEVADDGPGVAPDARDAIFEPFRQAPRRGGPAPGGTGLGLSICRHIVRRHGGRLWVDDNERGGASFFVAVPRHVAAGAARSRTLGGGR